MTVVRVCSFAIPLAVFALTGCSDEFAGREPISGTVTIKGEPLKTATVMFEPLANQGTGGSCAVADGKFELPRQSGLKAGKYLVRVTAGDGKTQVTESGDAPPGPGGGTNIISFDVVPPDWAEASKNEVEVKAGQKNEFKFEIPKAREKRTKR